VTMTSDVRTILLPSEDDDGSAAEIARLRTALATAERERDEARDALRRICAADGVTGDLSPAADADVVILSLADRDALSRERDTARTEASWALLHLSRIAVAAGLTKDENSASAPEEVLRAVEGAAASLASTRAELEAAMVVVEAAVALRRAHINASGPYVDPAVRSATFALRKVVDAFRSRTKEKQP
jgi:hypothetical protein